MSNVMVENAEKKLKDAFWSSNLSSSCPSPPKDPDRYAHDVCGASETTTWSCCITAESKNRGAHAEPTALIGKLEGWRPIAFRRTTWHLGTNLILYSY